MNATRLGISLIGNDVVDLSDPEALPSPRTSRFDDRVFNDAERQRITLSRDPIAERWSHWAAKEAGYKLVRKLNPDVIFSPRKIQVEFDPHSEISERSDTASSLSPRRGKVTATGHRFDCRIIRGERFVHALCTPSSDDSGESFGHRCLGATDPDHASPAGLSEAVRRLARTRIAEILGLDVEALTIQKEDGIPHLCMRGERLPVDLSLSHHGRVVAYACRFADSMSRESGLRDGLESLQ